MNGLIRKAGLFTLGALLLASMAAAGVPNGTNSTIDAGVVLGCASTGAGAPNGVEAIDVADPAILKTWTIRDGNNVAVPNVLVCIDFSACTANQFRLCSYQTGGGLGTTVNCTAKTVCATTDGLGQVTFAVLGHISTGGPQTNGACAQVTSLGQNLRLVRVAGYDQGVGGMDPGDVTRVLGDSFAYTSTAGADYRMRSDFDGDGTVGPGDVAYALARSFQTTSTGTGAFSCSTPCP